MRLNSHVIWFTPDWSLEDFHVDIFNMYRWDRFHTSQETNASLATQVLCNVSVVLITEYFDLIYCLVK